MSLGGVIFLFSLHLILPWFGVASNEVSIVIDRVVAFPDPDTTDSILLRNLGNLSTSIVLTLSLGHHTIKLHDWWLTDIRKNKTDRDAVYFFGQEAACSAYQFLPPSGILYLTPYTILNPCGVPFGVSTQDQLHLYNDVDAHVGYVVWEWALPGLALHRSRDGSYEYRSENKPVAEIMEDQGNLADFIKALQVSQEWKSVYTTSGKKRADLKLSPNDLIPYLLEEEEGLERNETFYNMFLESLPANEMIFPDPGRLTVLAPTNEAMQQFYQNQIFEKNLTPEEIRNRSEFMEIVRFHIIPNEWMSGFFIDGLSMQTSLKDANVTFIRSEGKVQITGSCQEPVIDSNTCTCGGDCSEIIDFDLFASNGIVHVINKVLIPSHLSWSSQRAETHEEKQQGNSNKGKEENDAWEEKVDEEQVLADMDMELIGVLQLELDGPDTEFS